MNRGAPGLDSPETKPEGSDVLQAITQILYPESTLTIETYTPQDIIGLFYIFLAKNNSLVELPISPSHDAHILAHVAAREIQKTKEMLEGYPSGGDSLEEMISEALFFCIIMERNMYGGERSALEFVEEFLRHSSLFFDINMLINSAMNYDISLGWWIMSLLYTTEQIFSFGTTIMERKPPGYFHYRNKNNLIDPIVENHILKIYYFSKVPIHLLDHLLGVRLCAFTDIEDFRVYGLSNPKTRELLQRRIDEYVNFLITHHFEKRRRITDQILEDLDELSYHLQTYHN